MAKYIDAEKIPYYLIAPDDTNTAAEGKRVAFKNEIDKMTVADVQEVKHGRWSDTMVYQVDPIFGDSHFGFKCSECREVLNKTIYCGNCGAKMDGKENTADEHIT